jgi:hypothetical protein
MLEDINDIKKEILEYIEIKTDLVRLHIAENLSRILSRAANTFIIGYLLLFILLFLSFAAGYFFGSLMHSTESGFLLVALFYFFVLVIFLLFRKHIIERPVIKSVMKLLFPKIRNDEEKS